MIRIENLTKRYGSFTALNNLNLTIEKGEIFGFVGPNGAGKTTTMRIMCGLLKATSGNVYIDDIDALRKTEDIKRRIGYVPDFFGVYDNLTVIEYMEFYGSMYGMDRTSIDEISEGLLELVNLSDKRDVYVDSLSRGMKQRLCVARALIHNPDLLILDEPNSGLDPRARFEMKEILKNLGAMGKTIIISSHILPELSELCTSIGIIDHGQMIVSGKLEDIMNEGRGKRPVMIKGFVEGMDRQQSYDKISSVLLEQPKVIKVKHMEDELAVMYDGDENDMSLLLKSLVNADINISQFYREKSDLESLFLDITGGGYNEK